MHKGSGAAEMDEGAKRARSGDGTPSGAVLAEKEWRKLRPVLESEGLTRRTTAGFRRAIYGYYRLEGRDLPWRRTSDPYRILLSEFMLQQTQVERVLGKYEIFLDAFPELAALAEASLSEVLSLWQGLGYNRRAKSLWETARLAVAEWGGRFPEEPEELELFPGIGRATAGAVAAFAFNRPAVFVETNIRRVYIHFFYHRREDVRDSEIMPLVEKTVDRKDPRQWYYALMDYGVMLKKSVVNPNRRSAHYKRQSPFEGSDRQVRSRALKLLLEQGALPEKDIPDRLAVDRKRAARIIDGLLREGFLTRRRGVLKIA